MLVNEAIRFPQVRVIGPEGETLGIMKSHAALEMAYDKGLDLVLMAAQSDPPVASIGSRMTALRWAMSFASLT